MLRLLVISCLVAVSVQAQPLAVTSPAEAGTGRRVALGVVGLAGGVAAAVGTATLLRSDQDSSAGVTLVVLAYPVGATLAMQALREALGDRVPLLTTVQDVALGMAAGALVGVVVGGAGAGVGYLVETVASDNGEYVVGPAVGGLVGGVAGVVTMMTVSTRHVRVAPTVLELPTGERTTGLSLRIGL